MVGGGKSKRTGSGKRGSLQTKTLKSKKFNARHVDQIWEDVRKPQGVHDGKTGPLGTTDKAALDEDLPDHGKHYCIACSRYFVSATALSSHLKTKPHKKRVKELTGARPHNQGDADWAAGMGAPDTGVRTRSPGDMDL